MTYEINGITVTLNNLTLGTIRRYGRLEPEIKAAALEGVKAEDYLTNDRAAEVMEKIWGVINYAVGETLPAFDELVASKDNMDAAGRLTSDFFSLLNKQRTKT